MPRIIVMADNPTDDTRAVMFTERVNTSDFESTHFQKHLVERLQWAVGDAHVAESTPREPRPNHPTESRPNHSTEPHPDHPDEPRHEHPDASRPAARRPTAPREVVPA